MQKGLNDLRDEISDWSQRKGFRDDRDTPGELIALGHSEFTEALEQIRDGHRLDETYWEHGKDCQNRQDHFEDGCSTKKPEGVPIELADVIIRVLEMSGRWNIDIENAVRIKIEYNETRPYQHGGRVLNR